MSFVLAPPDVSSKLLEIRVNALLRMTKIFVAKIAVDDCSFCQAVLKLFNKTVPIVIENGTKSDRDCVWVDKTEMSFQRKNISLNYYIIIIFIIIIKTLSF
jgi:hypothetical protein